MHASFLALAPSPSPHLNLLAAVTPSIPPPFHHLLLTFIFVDSRAPPGPPVRSRFGTGSLGFGSAAALLVFLVHFLLFLPLSPQISSHPFPFSPPPFGACVPVCLCAWLSASPRLTHPHLVERSLARSPSASQTTTAVQSAQPSPPCPWRPSSPRPSCPRARTCKSPAPPPLLTTTRSPPRRLRPSPWPHRPPAVAPTASWQQQRPPAVRPPSAPTSTRASRRTASARAPVSTSRRSSSPAAPRTFARAASPSSGRRACSTTRTTAAARRRPKRDRAPLAPLSLSLSQLAHTWAQSHTHTLTRSLYLSVAQCVCGAVRHCGRCGPPTLTTTTTTATTTTTDPPPLGRWAAREHTPLEAGLFVDYPPSHESLTVATTTTIAMFSKSLFFFIVCFHSLTIAIDISSAREAYTTRRPALYQRKSNSIPYQRVRFTYLLNI